MKISIIGYGKMGHEIERTAVARGHEIAAAVDGETDFITKAEMIKGSDVAIEFSTPSTAAANISRCFHLGLPVVCGTTGWYEHLPEIKELCIKEKTALLYASNFSIGMNFMFRLNREMADFAKRYGYDMSITETHHIHKIDKPSGTAVTLANEILEKNNRYSCWKSICEGETTSENELPVKSIREGEVFGIHEIEASGESDKISLRHEAFSRTGFAIGAVIAAEFIQNKRGIFTMNDVINIK
ncbi:MAG: 4-hydroxy-tetrahydrodipicolinate reductase [Bacteroidales bacterium]|nr:4-hydroxy-tetrahydrodipicolinate reductase [Bacteroidales bacterium]